MKTTIKSVLILAVGVAAASFTTKTIMEKVSVKSSSITWVGKKVTIQELSILKTVILKWKVRTSLAENFLSI